MRKVAPASLPASSDHDRKQHLRTPADAPSKFNSPYSGIPREIKFTESLHQPMPQSKQISKT